MPLRFGNISEIDPSACYARVKFLDDEIVSDWLQIVVMGAISNEYFHIFDINEQVACLMDDNSEEGVILGALFNDKTKPSNGGKDIVRVSFSDYSYIEYNRASHQYNINVKGKINIESEGETSLKAQSLKVQSPTINISGEANLTGNLTVSGTVTAASISSPSISSGGLSVSGDNISTPGEVTAGGIGLKSHKHSGVQTGSGTSGPAIP